MHGLLESILLMLTAAVLVVVLCRTLHLPAILGYLVVGVAIGPHALGLINASSNTAAIAEFGVVFLMFSIGLEFSLAKLKTLRVDVFGLGGLQMLITALLFFVMALWLGAQWPFAIALSGAIALSSTAIVSKMLAERGELGTPHGQKIFGILLFQDLAVVPLLVLIPALGQPADQLAWALVYALLKAAAVLILLLGVGQKILRPWFDIVAKQHSSELFVLNVLLVTLGISYATELAGLSLSLGAFVAGMLIAETHYRHQVEEDIKPFRDILLGLFFITIGMQLNLGLLWQQMATVLGLFALMVIAKAGLIWLLSRKFKQNAPTATRIALALAQAGEFGFVVLALATKQLTYPEALYQSILAAMLLSMFVAPFVIQHSDWLVRKLCGSEWLNQSRNLHKLTQQAMQVDEHVILCGYGRSGQRIARLLAQEQVPFFALDLDPERVSQAAAAGDSVAYGDAAKREVLIAAGLPRAKALVISYADVSSSLKILHHVQAIAPELPVIVRSTDDKYIETLKAAGATEVVAEIMEGSLMLASQTLMILGIPLNRVVRRIRLAREQQYQLFKGFFTGDSDLDDYDADLDKPRLQSLTVTADMAFVGLPIQSIPFADWQVELRLLRRPNTGQIKLNQNPQLQVGDVLVLLGLEAHLEEVQARFNR